jgi:hypothetical protein
MYRLKFRCEEAVQVDKMQGDIVQKGLQVRFAPIFAYGYPEEDVAATVFGSTPEGSVVFTAYDSSAVSAFKVGDYYYADFSPVAAKK